MATICFRPPPLPPSKTNNKSNNNNVTNTNRAGRIKQNHSLLSSTYLSFRDPAEDDNILSTNEEIELTSFKCNKNNNVINTNKRCRRVTHSNSLRRCNNKEQYDNGKKKTSSMSRSHSDGNLDRKAVLDRGNGDDLDMAVVSHSQMGINRYMKVLSGSWKNLLNLGGMSRPPKPAATAKKVAPPAVPHEFRHSGSSFGSAGYASSEDAAFLAPAPDPPGVPRDDHSDYGSTVSSSTGKSPGPIFPAPSFTFPGQTSTGGVLTHKVAVYYHHQLSLQEDQGIDMTQSPGRDSPGSSSGSAGSGSRHSTASLDSGRASYHPLSTAGGRSTIGSSNSPRCSLSSCSIGSDQGRIERMIHQGVPDQEIIHSWLVDLQFEEYFPLFISAGYDLPTIGRMTPEDLTAIGIKKPNHRKRLKAEIAQLNLPDNLPEFIPGSLEEWLNLLRLDEYLPAFIEQNYQTVDDVTQLAWEDLEEFGIVKLGHQKKIMLAIKRIKDIKAGKRINSDSSRIYATQDVLVHANPLDMQQAAAMSPPSVAAGSSSVHHLHSTFRSFNHQPWEQLDHMAARRQQYHNNAAAIHQQQQTFYCTDIVPIKIRTGRGKSLESLEDPNEQRQHHHHHTFCTDTNTSTPHQTSTFYYQHQPIVGAGWRPRSYDDGDITPTNETSLLLYEGGGGTLPRPRGVIRPRPIAKIAAKARDSAPTTTTTSCAFPDFEKPQFIINPENYAANSAHYKTLPPVRDVIDGNNKYHNMQYGSPLMGKKIPPHPPKRQDSNDSSNNNNEQTTTVEIHHHNHQYHVQTSSPLPLPAYPSSDSLSISLDNQGEHLPLPPPPAPGTPPGSSKMNQSQSWGAEEQELIKTLALQHRNGSDASFKSSSSTESDSLPFANENAGTIRTRAAAAAAAAVVVGCSSSGTGNNSSSSISCSSPSLSKNKTTGLPPHPAPGSSGPTNYTQQSSPQVRIAPTTVSSSINNSQRQEPADVLNDIGNMLANLTDELDAMLEEEKRQQ